MAPVAGLIVNPIAGMGGRVALHGTDGDAARRACELGAGPVAGPRAARALARLRRGCPAARIVAARGAMGADLLRDWPAVTVLEGHTGPTSAADTRAAARAMSDVDILLFAGGDGTARDVLNAVGTGVPVLGVPTGVKMRSGVFATTPEAAGDLAARFLSQPDAGSVPLRDAEILDVVDGLERLFGVARAPYAAGVLQAAKSGPPAQDEAALEAACRAVAAELAPGLLYLFGPGTTTARILGALGLTGTLTGVDAVRDGALVGSNLSEVDILELLSDGNPAAIVLGVIGGQGFLLGRGNQQLSPAVLARVGAENVIIVASAEKLAALDPPVLRADLGDERAEPVLTGYRRVRTGARRTTVLKIES